MKHSVSAVRSFNDYENESLTTATAERASQQSKQCSSPPSCDSGTAVSWYYYLALPSPVKGKNECQNVGVRQFPSVKGTFVPRRYQPTLYF